MCFGHEPLFRTYANPEQLDTHFPIMAINDGEAWLLLTLLITDKGTDKYFESVLRQLYAYYSNSNCKDLLQLLKLRYDTYEVVTKVINDWCLDNYISPVDRQGMANSLYNYQLNYLDLVKRSYAK